MTAKGKQAQGENPKATDERVFAGTGLPRDIAAPVVTLVSATDGAARIVRARVHDRKSPSQPFDWKSVVARITMPTPLARSVAKRDSSKQHVRGLRNRHRRKYRLRIKFQSSKVPKFQSSKVPRW
jgi:hypothetical protein